MGYFEDGVAQPAVPIHTRPAVQFTTTADDMGRLAQFLMGDGRLGDTLLIAPALLAALGGGHGTDAARAGLTVGHGLALATRDRHQALGDCHPGTGIGFQAMFCLYPREGKAFFVAVNADVESADYDKLNKSLIEALRLAAPPDRRPASAPPADLAQWEGIYVPAWNAVPRLAWLDTRFNFVDVRWDGNALRLAPFQGKPASLHPAGGRLFQASGRIQPSHVLLMSDGKHMLSDGLRTYRQEPIATMLCLWTSAALGLSGLCYVLVRGAWMLARGRLRNRSTLAVPLASVLMLLAPIPLFVGQSFQQLGDLTQASGLLAFATGALPVGMVYGLVSVPAKRVHGVSHPAFDCLALLAVTQLPLVLVAWGMLPFVLWH
jgi:hypothetical protein